MTKVLKLTANWCGPCKTLTRTLENIKSSLEIEEIDVDDNPELAKEYKIKNLPTLILIKDGKEVQRLVGVHSPTKIEQFLNN